MDIRKIRQFFLLFVAAAALSCSTVSCGGDDPEPAPVSPDNGDNKGDEGDDPEPPVDITPNALAKGADVSWLTELEDKGSKFYNAAGEETELMQLLRDECGVNAIRLRVWVNPADKYNSIADVMVKARRAHASGLRLMIDFHMSDSWADPGKQVVPDAWKSYNAAQMAAAVGSHVTEMLTKLKDAGINPEWVQIGNEVTPGMLHPMGEMKDQQANEFPRFLNAGYDAVKEIFPNAKVIVHLDCGNNSGTYRWFFDLLDKNKGKYDMIGMSLYPFNETGSNETWSATIDNQAITDCIANIKAVNLRYGKPVMLCEIGFHHTMAADCKKTLRRFINEFDGTDILKGIFYWEPEAEPDNTGYHKGCFHNGRPTEALDAFKGK